MKSLPCLLNYSAGIVFVFSCLPVTGQIFFQDDFDSGTSADHWIANPAGPNASADFAFDYSTYGIPSAPNSVGGTTIGLRLTAHATDGVLRNGISVSPMDQSFEGDFVLTFDLWANFNGPLLDGGPDSTQFTGFGIGSYGYEPQWAAGEDISLHFGVSGDGQNTWDYRVYANNAIAAGDSGYYAAGDRNATNEYYTSAGIGGRSAPPAQLAMYPGQTGETSPGAAGMAWRQMELMKKGDVVTWKMDGLLIATIPDYSELYNIYGSNIFFNQSDTFGGGVQDLIFGVIDNVVVAAIPEPVKPVALAIRRSEEGGIVLAVSGDSLFEYQLEAAADPGGIWEPLGSVTTDGDGIGELPDPDANEVSRRFYRVILP